MKAIRVARIFRLSLRALRRNKMRTALTMLGIVIGVGAVIAMVSIGAGASAAIDARFAAMINVLTINAGNRNVASVSTGSGGAKLTEDDANAIAEKCPSVLYVSPVASTRQQVVFNNKNWSTNVRGVNEYYPDIENWEVEQGIFFDYTQMSSALCVLGADIVTNLFSGENAVGKIIRIGKVPFTVIGTLKAKGQSGFGSRDDLIFIPFGTIKRFLGTSFNLQSIQVSARSPELVDQLQIEVIEVLRTQHKLAAGRPDDFTVRNMSDIAESAAETQNIMTVLLGSIASISLLVGGIGIMNIMLMSVTERIREIGIRIAIGAQEADVLLQFLLEAIVLSLTGGILGIAFGYGVSKLMYLIPMFSTITTMVTPSSVLLAFGFSAAIGIFFGFYPARKASKLDPIEALRYE